MLCVLLVFYIIDFYIYYTVLLDVFIHYIYLNKFNVFIYSDLYYFIFIYLFYNIYFSLNLSPSSSLKTTDICNLIIYIFDIFYYIFFYLFASICFINFSLFIYLIVFYGVFNPFLFFYLLESF